MLLHYFKIALRNLRKYPAQTAISVLGLAAGFVCLSLSALWMHYENTYDTMHKDYERIYAFTNAENLERAGLDYSRTRLMTTSTLVNGNTKLRYTFGYKCSATSFSIFHPLCVFK